MVVFKPCGQQPSRSFIQNVSREPAVVTLIGFMLISVASEISVELGPHSRCVALKRNARLGPAGSSSTGSSWCDDEDEKTTERTAAA